MYRLGSVAKAAGQFNVVFLNNQSSFYIATFNLEQLSGFDSHYADLSVQGASAIKRGDDQCTP